MPIEYRRDDARHRIRITLTDPLTVAELIESVECQLSDGAWRYALLVDARATFPAPQPTDMRLFLSRVRELVAAHGARGPIAILARESGAISGAQMYIFFGGKMEDLEVFWDIDAARRWLDLRMVQGLHAPETD
jgi:hypothetical protein